MGFSINLSSISLGEAFKRALFEKIFDEYDVKVADKALEEYLKSGKESRLIEKLWLRM